MVTIHIGDPQNSDAVRSRFKGVLRSLTLTTVPWVEIHCHYRGEWVVPCSVLCPVWAAVLGLPYTPEPWDQQPHWATFVNHFASSGITTRPRCNSLICIDIFKYSHLIVLLLYVIRHNSQADQRSLVWSPSLVLTPLGPFSSGSIHFYVIYIGFHFYKRFYFSGA